MELIYVWNRPAAEIRTASDLCRRDRWCFPNSFQIQTKH